jgi:hypothetical protein
VIGLHAVDHNQYWLRTESQLVLAIATVIVF